MYGFRNTLYRILLSLIIAMVGSAAMAESSSIQKNGIKGVTAHAMHQGHKAHGKSMRHHSSCGHHTPKWKSGLSDEQRNTLKKLKLAHKQFNYPLKAQKKKIKIELTILATADNPDNKAIESKINELLEIKRALMRDKYQFIAAKRQQLKPEQRVDYDLYMLKRAKHKKKCGYRGYGRGHH